MEEIADVASEELLVVLQAHNMQPVELGSRKALYENRCVLLSVNWELNSNQLDIRLARSNDPNDYWGLDVVLGTIDLEAGYRYRDWAARNDAELRDGLRRASEILLDGGSGLMSGDSAAIAKANEIAGLYQEWRMKGRRPQPMP